MQLQPIVILKGRATDLLVYPDGGTHIFTMRVTYV